MVAWARRICTLIGTLESKKRPMPKVVIHTTVSVMMNTAAAAKTGRQRAASQSNSGNSNAIGTDVPSGAFGRTITKPDMATSAASATAPSMSSWRGGTLRRTAASSMISGATVMMPSASEANQCCQVSSTGAVEFCR